MADPIVKTSVRIPESVHLDIERAATEHGLTVNGEMVYRLRHDPRSEHARAIIDAIDKRDVAALDQARRQLAALWNVMDRADGALEEVLSAMSLVKPGSDVAVLKRELQFVRELISTARAHR